MNWVKNYDHKGETHPHQEVEDGYIFINILVKITHYLTNHFFVILLSR